MLWLPDEKVNNLKKRLATDISDFTHELQIDVTARPLLERAKRADGGLQVAVEPLELGQFRR